MKKISTNMKIAALLGMGLLAFGVNSYAGGDSYYYHIKINNKSTTEALTLYQAQFPWSGSCTFYQKPYPPQNIDQSTSFAYITIFEDNEFTCGGANTRLGNQDQDWGFSFRYYYGSDYCDVKTPGTTKAEPLEAVASGSITCKVTHNTDDSYTVDFSH